MKKIDQFLILLYRIIYVIAVTQIIMLIQSHNVVFSIALNIIYVYLLLMIDKTMNYFLYIKPSYEKNKNKTITIGLRMIGMLISFACILLLSYLYALGLYSIVMFLIVVNIVYLLLEGRLFFDVISLKYYDKEYR